MGWDGMGYINFPKRFQLNQSYAMIVLMNEIFEYQIFKKKRLIISQFINLFNILFSECEIGYYADEMNFCAPIKIAYKVTYFLYDVLCITIQFDTRSLSCFIGQGKNPIRIFQKFDTKSK